MPAAVSTSPEWLRIGLLALAAAAAAAGVIELYRLATGRRSALAGYGWETEVAHVIMNLAMAVMLTSLWSAPVAWLSAALLGCVALALAIVPATRPHHPGIERSVIVIAATIHVLAAALMAWLMVRMAPETTVAGRDMAVAHHGAMTHDMTMSLHHAGTGAQSWLAWLCAAFFIFDLVSVIAVTAFARGRLDRPGEASPSVSIVPHLAMDIGMIAMLATF